MQRKLNVNSGHEHHAVIASTGATARTRIRELAELRPYVARAWVFFVY
jgi:hypothetical protein